MAAFGQQLWLGAAALSLLIGTGCTESFDGPPEILAAQLIPNPTSSSDPSGLQEIKDGTTVSLVRPIQGGHVLFVGIFGRNLSQRSGSVLGQLRRSQAADGTPLPQPGGILFSDERSVNIVPIPTGATPPRMTLGWQQVLPEPNDLANLPACPNPVDVDVVDNPLYLQLTYNDAAGRSATATHKVVPRCLQSDPDERRSCVCECLANYTTTRCVNSVDGGPPND